MRIEINYKERLIDGELTNDGTETINTKKPFSITKIRQYDKEGKRKEVMYLQIGHFLEKDFIERLLDDAAIYVYED